MINKESFELYDKLVNENQYNKLFDISIIYQVSETLNYLDKELGTYDFMLICNEVKRQYLKNDVALNDDLVGEVLEKEGL